MTANYAKTSFASFVTGYLLLYYLTICLSMTIFPETVTHSWNILGENATAMKLVLLGSPALGVLFGSFAASISLLSYTAMGSDRLGPSKFFGIGWLCIFLSNMMTLSVGLQLFIDEKIGREWIRYLGEMKFKTCFFLLAPSFAYVGGVTAVILLRKLIEAQKS
jgi:hypothetical protein